MIFAIADYVQYLFKKGRYSEQALREQHAYLCSRENIEAYIKTSEPGDLILLHIRVSLISWLIMYYTNSIWSHVSGVATDNCVCETTPRGVIKSPITSYIDNKSYFSARRIQDRENVNMEKVVAWVQDKVGAGYDWALLFIMFFSIIFGRSHHWKLIYSLDIYIVLAVLVRLGIMPTLPSLIAAGIYAFVLLFNLSTLVRELNEHRVTM